MDVLEGAEVLAISAGTVAEALIVADRRGLGEEMRRLLDGLGFEIAPSRPRLRGSSPMPMRVGQRRSSRRSQLRRLFRYVLASERAAPLLYVGDDFAQTDISSARRNPPQNDAGVLIQSSTVSPSLRFRHECGLLLSK